MRSTGDGKRWLALALGALTLAGAACGGSFTAQATGDGGDEAGNDGGSDGNNDATVDADAGSDRDAASEETGSPDGQMSDTGGAEAGLDGWSIDATGGDAACLDCADPNCTAYVTCVPDPPPGWKYVTLELGGQSPCLSGYGPHDNVAVPGGPPSCGCTCSDGGTSCSGQDLTVGTGAGCASSFQATTTGCQTFLNALAPNEYVNVPDYKPVAIACMTSAMNTIVNESAGRLCPLATTGTGCAATLECVGVTGNLPLCVEQPGDVNCPPGFALKHPLADSYVDTRSCTACACSQSPSACLSQGFTFYETANCMPLGYGAGAGKGCVPLGNAGPLLSYAWDAVPSGGDCSGGSSTPAGGETPTSPVTVCCH